MPAPVRSALMLGALLATNGCQLVFGIDGFDTAAEPGGGAGSGGGLGAGTSFPGGGGAGGAPPACECELPAGWTVTSIQASGANTGTLPTSCGNGGAHHLMFGEPPAVMCGACGCTPGGCGIPTLTCYGGLNFNCNNADAANPPQIVSLGTSCGPAVYASCVASGDLGEPSCTVDGGAPLAAYDFASYFSICEDAACGDGCSAGDEQCVMNDGIVPTCPPGFPINLTVYAAGQAACDCSCTGDCGTPLNEPFLMGAVSCASPVGTTCAGPFGAGAIAAAPTCSTNHDVDFPGEFATSGARTVCCKEPPIVQ